MNLNKKDESSYKNNEPLNKTFCEILKNANLIKVGRILWIS